MIVKNEERCLDRCLKAVRDYVDEIVILDTGSMDRTKAIALENRAHVHDYVWCDDFSAARNEALRISESLYGADVQLVLDADEYLDTESSGTPEALKQYIERMRKRYGSSWMGAVRRKDQYPDNGQYSESIALIPRILPAGIRYQGSIHEQPGCEETTVTAPLCFVHDGYIQPGKGERNLALLRRAVAETPEDAYLQFQTGATLRNMQALTEAEGCFEQFYRLIPDSSPEAAYQGYREEGILLYLYTLYDLGGEERLLRAMEILNREEKNFTDSPDFYFFKGLYFMKLVLFDTAKYIGYLQKIEESYLRCLEIGEDNRLSGVIGTGSFKAAHNLAAWYEVSGQKAKAEHYYRLAEGKK